jgi:hypothetical protein
LNAVVCRVKNFVRKFVDLILIVLSRLRCVIVKLFFNSSDKELIPFSPRKSPKLNSILSSKQINYYHEGKEL